MRVPVISPQNASPQQRALRSGHHKVVRLIAVVDNVLQLNARLLLQVLEPLLVVDAADAADLRTVRLLLRPPVDVVGGEADCELSTAVVSRKVPAEGVSTAVAADDDVEGLAAEVAGYCRAGGGAKVGVGAA